jgi:hypothetical protein
VSGDHGVHFQRDSDRTSPKPSRIDVCTITSEKALQGVDLDVADAGEVGVEVNVRIVGGVLGDLLVNPPALGIVERHRSDERGLQAGDLLAYETVGRKDPQGVLPGRRSERPGPTSLVATCSSTGSTISATPARRAVRSMRNVEGCVFARGPLGAELAHGNTSPGAIRGVY